MLLAVLLLLPVCKTEGQNIAVKSDLLTGMLSSPNLGVEVRLSERFTLETGFHYNPFPAGENKRWKHWFVQSELRYWMCQPYGGHFFGVNLTYGVYNAGKMKLPLGLFKGVRSDRYEGNVMARASRTATTLSSSSALGTGNKPRHRISAHRIRTLPLPALRRKDGKRAQELHSSHKSGRIAGVYDKIVTRIIT